MITDQQVVLLRQKLDGRQDTAVSGGVSRHEREIGKEVAAGIAAFGEEEGRTKTGERDLTRSPTCGRVTS